MGIERILCAYKGQVRMFEAVIAVIIIFSVFSVSIFLMRPPRTWVLHEKEDLDRLGYNVLHNLIETEAIEATLELGKGDLAEGRIKALIEGVLSITTYYNFTIFKYEKGQNILWQRFISVSNAPQDEFNMLSEKSSTMVIYTSRSGEVYYIILVLAKRG